MVAFSHFLRFQVCNDVDLSIFYKGQQGAFYLERQLTWGATRPRIGICKSRLDALTCKYMNINTLSIANLGH